MIKVIKSIIQCNHNWEQQPGVL